MKVAILGYGQEGQAAEKYFKGHGDETQVFDPVNVSRIGELGLGEFDLVMRSPSIRPIDDGWSSSTKYFLEHCPATVIGVTGTKGKGTTSSMISSLLEALGRKVWLVGNIGKPAIEVLDEVGSDDVVVYEMSSFQLWDVKQSPAVAVVLPIEPDHLNIHKDFDEYVDAKANIARWQEPGDACIYYEDNEWSCEIAEKSPGVLVHYPLPEFDKKFTVLGWQGGKIKLFKGTDVRAEMDEMLGHLAIPGRHNRENAEAALLAVAAYLQVPVDELLEEYHDELAQALAEFKGLPHRLEFLRELDGVKYYDDNFATNVASTRVAIEAFPDNELVMIVGGRDKTGYKDLVEIDELLEGSEQIKKVVLIGELGHELAERYQSDKFTVTESLKEALALARDLAEGLSDAVVLMSPAAASFDMFENVYDRGDQFAKLVAELK